MTEAERSGHEILWTWESAVPFVSLGRTSRAEEELFLKKCLEENVEVIRRLSGGCSVLLAPGCLNFSFVLRYERDTALSGVESSYAYILDVLEGALGGLGVDVRRKGLSDLVFRDRKVSGNAQIRRKDLLLHHGTILYRMDLSCVTSYLRHPPREPVYRSSREHEEFLGNLPIGPERLKEALRGVFMSDEIEREVSSHTMGMISALVRERYSENSWNLRF